MSQGVRTMVKTRFLFVAAAALLVAASDEDLRVLQDALAAAAP